MNRMTLTTEAMRSLLTAYAAAAEPFGIIDPDTQDWGIGRPDGPWALFTRDKSTGGIHVLARFDSQREACDHLRTMTLAFQMASSGRVLTA